MYVLKSRVDSLTLNVSHDQSDRKKIVKLKTEVNQLIHTNIRVFATAKESNS